MKLSVIWRNSNMTAAKTELVQNIYSEPFRRYPAQQLHHIFDSAKANMSRSNGDYNRWHDLDHEGRARLLDENLLLPSEVRAASFSFVFQKEQDDERQLSLF